MSSGFKNYHTFSIEYLARSSVPRAQNCTPNTDAVITSSHTCTSNYSPASSVTNNKDQRAKEKLANTSADSGCSTASSFDENLNTSDEDKRNTPVQKTRKRRETFHKEQITELEAMFGKQKYLTPAERNDIATKLGLTSQQVKTWFQNRRMKEKRAKENSHSPSIPLLSGSLDKRQSRAMEINLSNRTSESYKDLTPHIKQNVNDFISNSVWPTGNDGSSRNSALMQKYHFNREFLHLQPYSNQS